MKKSIFISSVIKGFEPLREAAKKAVSDLSQEPVMAEDFGSLPVSPQRACLEGVRLSDIYLGILGTRYGHETPSEISATEEEYEEAKKLNKKIFILIQEGEKESKQDAFVKKVSDYIHGKFRDTFKDESELYSKIIKSLSRHIFEERTDYSQTDTRVIKYNFGATLVDNQNDPWLGAIAVPIASRSLFDILEIEDKDFINKVYELAFDNRVSIFNRKFASDEEVFENHIVFNQISLKGRHADFPVRKLRIALEGMVIYATELKEKEKVDISSGGLSFYFINPELLENHLKNFFAFIKAFYDKFDNRALISDLSLGISLINASDKHFAKPLRDQQGVTIPQVTQKGPILVPKEPYHLHRNELNEPDSLVKKFLTLIRRRYEERDRR